MSSIFGLTLAGCASEPARDIAPVEEEKIPGAARDATQDGESGDIGGPSGTPDVGAAEGEGEVHGEGEGEGEGEMIGEGEGELPRGVPAPLDFFKVADLPCDFPASLGTLETPQETSLLFTCNMPARLFETSLNEDGSLSEARQVGEGVGGDFSFAANHLPLTNAEGNLDGFVALSFSSPHGFAILNRNGELSQTIILGELPSLHLLEHPLTFPSGMALASGKLCVATANLDEQDFTTYHPGTVLCFDYNEGLVNIDETEPEIFETSSLNPTGMGLFDGKVVVVNSNSFAPTENQEAAIDFFDPLTLESSSIPLGAFTAQISPHLAIDPSGKMAVGVQPPTNALAIVDLGEGFVNDYPLPIRNFISHITRDGDVAIISDQGMLDFGGNVANDQTGQVLLHPAGGENWESIPATPVSGNAGQTVVVGGSVYLAVTSRSEADPAALVGSLWKAETTW